MSLETGPEPESRQQSTWENVKQNEKVQQAKEVSQQYLKFFVQVLKNPSQSSKQVGEEHLINTWITLGLIVLLAPLFIIFTSLREGLGFYFTESFLQPLFYIALALAVSIGSIVVIFKLYNVQMNVKRVLVQFGTFVVPVTIGLAAATIFGLIGLGDLPTYLVIVSLLFTMVAMNTIIIRNAANVNSKFDLSYSLVIVNFIVGYLYYKLVYSVMGSILLKQVETQINSFFDFF